MVKLKSPVCPKFSQRQLRALERKREARLPNVLMKRIERKRALEWDVKKKGK